MSRTLPILNLTSYIILVIVNFFAVRLPFFGRRPGDVSDLYPNLLTPPDFSFKIWGPIYVLLGVLIIHQSKGIFDKERGINAETKAIGSLFFISCLFNIGWLVTWQSLYILPSFLLIFALWIILMIIYYRLVQVGDAKLLYTVPISIYLGWICISTLANLNVLLIDSGFGFFGMSQETWTAGLIVLGLFGTLLVLYLNRDLWFTAVLLWAFYGMIIKNYGLASGETLVIYTAGITIFILIAVASVVGYKKWSRKGGHIYK